MAMTCEHCDIYQEKLLEAYDKPPLIYVRVSYANVLIGACPQHAKELMELLQHAKHTE